MGRFQKRSFFCENETIVFENDRLTKQKTIVKRSFSKTINNPTYMYRSTPEILRFHPIPPFIFPLSPFKNIINIFICLFYISLKTL